MWLAFFIAILLTAVLFVAIAAITNYLYSKSSYFKNKIGQTEKFKKGLPTNLQAVNLGSAHAREAFSYQDSEIAGFNFALQSQTLSYDYILLKRYSGHLAPGCRVFISIEPLLFCPIHFSGINNRMYYHFLQKEDIIEYSPLVNYAEKVVPGLASLTAIKALLRGDVEQPLVLGQEQREREADTMIACWKRNFDLDDTLNGNQAEKLREQMEYNQQKLKEIVSLCKKKSFVPIVVVLPMTHIMTSRFSPGFLRSFVYDNLECVSKDVPIIDYFEDERFSTRYDLFCDSEYLNEKGARLFTKTLLEETNYRGES